MDDDLREKDINNARPVNILLVEDNEADVKITLRAFAKSKIKSNMFVVNNGQDALDFIHHSGAYQDEGKYPRPDLVLLDIKMPKMDGFQFLEILKKDLEYSSIPVVMLTSSKTEEDIAKSFKYGAASFIQKPVSFEEFVKVVEKFNYYWYIINKLPSQFL
ncbi:MAG: response regulator [Candidatus Omnitrophica bacterium]|nr:response regulator [Candidatus Omnitrophota bacterium]